MKVRDPQVFFVALLVNQPTNGAVPNQPCWLTPRRVVAQSLETVFHKDRPFGVGLNLTPPLLVLLVKEMGVSKNRGTPKWMVYNNGKPYKNG